MNADLAAFLSSWAWEPGLLLALAAAAGLYSLGWRRLPQQPSGKRLLPPWRGLCYYGGLALIGLALLSPVAVFSALLFMMHMLQHVLLISAAPLVLLGSPLLPMLWALPPRPRRALGLLFVPAGPLHFAFHWLTNPFVAGSLYVFTVGLWHAPSFYDAAQGRSLLHDLEHVMFFGSSLLYWWPVVHPARGRRRLGYGQAIFYVAAPMLEHNALGMVLTFAQHPLYQTYQLLPRVWGISVVLDQQLAGAVMGVSGVAVNLTALTVLLVLFLRGEERKAVVDERSAGRSHVR